MRRLPPSLTPEDLIEQISPLPNHDFFYFVKADMSLGSSAFTRAYINFTNAEEIFNFRDKFDGYVFVDGKDPDYQKFLKTLESPEEEEVKSLDSYLEDLEAREKEMKANKGCPKTTTPLIEYLVRRREEKKANMLVRQKKLYNSRLLLKKILISGNCV
ncbi:hypothetical protein FSP39_016426 [Pinctada imbricata]|uniref:UPF3 domain-containing protein n=1 Tax=Pinctada imbricata TaxID=66713 RepID=A0AA88YAR0_PINIB|nr:hypothetical protein FSP39_016426 [Pinctada imbricata]